MCKIYSKSGGAWVMRASQRSCFQSLVHCSEILMVVDSGTLRLSMEYSPPDDPSAAMNVSSD